MPRNITTLQVRAEGEASSSMHVLKVCSKPLGFCKRPTRVPVFMTQKKSGKGFHFYEKRQEMKIAIRAGSAASPHRGGVHPERPRPRDYTQHLGTQPRASSCV